MQGDFWLNIFITIQYRSLFYYHFILYLKQLGLGDFFSIGCKLKIFHMKVFDRDQNSKYLSFPEAPLCSRSPTLMPSSPIVSCFLGNVGFVWSTLCSTADEPDILLQNFSFCVKQGTEVFLCSVASFIVTIKSTAVIFKVFKIIIIVIKSSASASSKSLSKPSTRSKT